jgi:hypothetical protein
MYILNLHERKVIYPVASCGVSTSLFLTLGPDNANINTSDTSTPTHNQISGPITWARACQLNN